MRETQQPDLWASEFVTFTAATIFLGLRFMSRRLTRVELWWDDWFALGTYTMAIAWAVIIPYWITQGLGLHIWDVHHAPKDDVLYVNKLVLYIAELVYATALFFGKASVLSFYWRMFRVTNIKLPIQILFGVACVWMIIRTVMGIWHCVPIETFWDVNVEGVCHIEDKKFFFGTILVHVLIDICILTLPIMQIRKLQLPILQKLGIMIIFIFGITVCVAALVIVVAATQFDDKSEDITWNLCTILKWGSVEVNLITISACLPTIRPAVLYLFTCTNPAAAIGSGSGSYGGQSYGRSQTKKSIRLSTMPKPNEGDESSSTHQLAESDHGGRGSASDFESHALDRYRGNVATVTGAGQDAISDDYHQQQGSSSFAGIMVKNETSVRITTARK
ncbi:hypothetical protein FZEAL_7399 [Fusarium zealandicum]|uniref:Rhodopsin domain-containing protein n=1 Tax=Fusarium zealandicum TaxID=1053134 RepID=A0A8H4UFV0_9HYPO|nr:hypothetical protein FZEAL_7399 [Fusarium zealandicum]